MNRKEYFEYLIPGIEPVLNMQGFEFKKSTGSFEKKINDGLLKVLFDFYQVGLYYEVNIAFIVRIHSVQNIVVNYIRMNLAEAKHTHTLIFLLSDLLNRPSPFKFRTEAELDEILLDKFLPFLELQLPVLSERFSKMENILQAYFSPNDSYNPFIYKNLYYNRVVPIVIAKLVAKNDFEKVVEWGRNEMIELKQKWPGSNEAELFDLYFEKLVRYLRTT
jgi:hypothetical protein